MSRSTGIVCGYPSSREPVAQSADIILENLNCDDDPVSMHGINAIFGELLISVRVESIPQSQYRVNILLMSIVFLKCFINSKPIPSDNDDVSIVL